jgi:hypothetical protein
MSEIIFSTGRLLESEYKRPKKTLTESVQNKKDIEEKLEGYDEVECDKLCYIPRKTHLRYIGWDKKNKKELFRFGGLLMTVKDQYVILLGKGAKTFSAQRYAYDSNGNLEHTTRFFRKMSKEELLQKKYENTITYSNEVFTKQKMALEKQQKEIEKLKKMLKKKK